MKSDLLSAISRERDVTDVLVLTHNIDFVFLQSVVLSALQKCGNPSLTVLADAGCALESYERQAPVLRHLGQRFRVVPVPMERQFCFHPKAILLSGERKATLFVGSGNLTFGGWRENGEVWLRFDTDEDPTLQVAAFREYVFEILARLPLAAAVLDDVEEAFDESRKTWAGELEEPGGLVGRVGMGTPLLDGILAGFGPEPVDELIVCSPYFDSRGDALEMLLDRLRPASTRVLIQHDRSGFPKDSVHRFSQRVQFQTIDFNHTDKNGRERRSFMHAKFYAVRRGDLATVFAGSANCSVAALVSSGPAGNAELLASQTLFASEFQTAYLDDLQFLDEPPRLPDQPEKGEENVEAPPALRVLAARLEGTRLTIGFHATLGVEISHCMVDGLAVEWQLNGPGTALATASKDVRSVVLAGSLDGLEVRSQPMWVDHEASLATRSHHRSFRQAIRKGFSPENWNLGAWSDVMEVYLRNLEYMPRTRRGPSTPTEKGEDDDANKLIEFSEADVFSSTYGLGPSSGLPDLGPGENVDNIGQLLLRWFSWGDQSNLEDEGEHEQEPEETGGKGEDEEESVDRQDDIPKPGAKRRREKEPPTEKERKRARRIIESVVSRIAAPDFLQARPPEHLAADLKVLAILLRTALAEEWLSEVEFFEATERIWKPLFFSSEDPAKGWIELRHVQAEDPTGFAARMASPELSAALAAWAFAIPQHVQDARQAAFRLVATLAVARVPWLWRGGTGTGIAEGMDQILSLTAGPGQPRDLGQFRGRWLDLMRQGEALRRLEASASDLPLEILREGIRAEQVPAGKLLWQGKAGFCVVTEHSVRDSVHKVPVFSLQGEVEAKKFRGDYTVPVSGLVEFFSRHGRLGVNEREALEVLLKKMEMGFGRSSAAREKPSFG